jgi:hypothetical protein
MAKKRLDIGSVRQNDKGQMYIKFQKDVTFKAGESITIYRKKDHLDSLEQNREKMSEETYTKAKERIENTPDWVKGELIKWVEA